MTEDDLRVQQEIRQARKTKEWGDEMEQLHKETFSPNSNSRFESSTPSTKGKQQPKKRSTPSKIPKRKPKREIRSALPIDALCEASKRKRLADELRDSDRNSRGSKRGSAMKPATSPGGSVLFDTSSWAGLSSALSRRDASGIPTIATPKSAKNLSGVSSQNAIKSGESSSKASSFVGGQQVSGRSEDAGAIGSAVKSIPMRSTMKSKAPGSTVKQRTTGVKPMAEATNTSESLLSASNLQKSVRFDSNLPRVAEGSENVSPSGQQRREKSTGFDFNEEMRDTMAPEASANVPGYANYEAPIYCKAGEDFAGAPEDFTGHSVPPTPGRLAGGRIPDTPRGAGFSLDLVELSKSKLKAKQELRAKNDLLDKEIEEDEAGDRRKKMKRLLLKNESQTSQRDIYGRLVEEVAGLGEKEMENFEDMKELEKEDRVATEKKKRRFEELKQANLNDLEEYFNEVEALTGQKPSCKAPIASSDREEVTHDLGDRFSQKFGGTEEETFGPAPAEYSRPVQGMAASVERTHGPRRDHETVVHHTIAAPAALNDTRQGHSAAYSRSVQDMAAPEAFASAERTHDDGPRVAAPAAANDSVKKPSRQDHALPARKAPPEPTLLECPDRLLNMAVEQIEEACRWLAENNASKGQFDRLPFEMLDKDHLKAVNLSLLGVAKLKLIFKKHSLGKKYRNVSKRGDLIEKIEEFLGS
ncbi:MAG: hypothetical protein SGILL_008683, partial [Bacillariaceae sp.]